MERGSQRDTADSAMEKGSLRDTAGAVERRSRPDTAIALERGCRRDALVIPSVQVPGIDVRADPSTFGRPAGLP